MAVTVKNIIPPKLAESAQTTQYTAVGVKCIVDKFTASNTSASPVTLAVNLVTFAGTAGALNLIVPAVSIDPGTVYKFPELIGQVMEASGFISTLASASSALTISASGREVS